MTTFDYAILYETHVRPRQRRQRLLWTAGAMIGASLTGVLISLVALI